MFLSPEVAIVQQNIGIMQVVGDYFENGMKYFQDLVYTAVSSKGRYARCEGTC
jgi:hypothetical protein